MNVPVILAHAVFFGFLSAWLAERKSYGAGSWFALGVLLGAIAPLLLFLQPDRRLTANAPLPPTR